MELQSRELEKQRDEELEVERRKEHENRKAKTSRAPSASSRTSRRRGSSVKPTERIVVTKEDTATEAAVKKRLATTKEPKKVTASVVPRATGRVKGSSSLISSTSALFSKMHAYMAANNAPSSILQTIVMLAVIAWMTNNKRMRDRIRKFLLLCWIKIARTIGMGMKVTYV